jgi:hypothetical protein
MIAELFQCIICLKLFHNAKELAEHKCWERG